MTMALIIGKNALSLNFFTRCQLLWRGAQAKWRSFVIDADIRAIYFDNIIIHSYRFICNRDELLAGGVTHNFCFCIV